MNLLTQPSILLLHLQMSSLVSPIDSSSWVWKLAMRLLQRCKASSYHAIDTGSMIRPWFLVTGWRLEMGTGIEEVPVCFGRWWTLYTHVCKRDMRSSDPRSLQASRRASSWQNWHLHVTLSAPRTEHVNCVITNHGYCIHHQQSFIAMTMVINHR